MKKKLLLLLFSAVMSLSFVVPVSANDAQNWDIEPNNNYFTKAPPIDNTYGSTNGNLFYGNVSSKDKVDNYEFFTWKTGTQTIVFRSPDSQKYLLSVYKKQDLEQGILSPVTALVSQSGGDKILTFSPEGDLTSYIFSITFLGDKDLGYQYRFELFQS